MRALHYFVAELRACPDATDIFQPACTASCHKAGVADGSDSYGLYDTEAKAYESVNKVSLYAGSEKTLKIVDPGKLDNSTMFMKCLAKAKSPAGKNLVRRATILGAFLIDAAYWVFIPHLIWIGLGVMFLRNVPIAPELKMLVVTLFSGGLSLATYVPLRRTKVGRWLGSTAPAPGYTP